MVDLERWCNKCKKKDVETCEICKENYYAKRPLFFKKNCKCSSVVSYYNKKANKNICTICDGIVHNKN